MIPDDKLHLLLHLTRVPGLGPTRIRSLFSSMQSISQLKRCRTDHLAANPVIGPKYAADLCVFPVDEEIHNQLIRQVDDTGGWILPFWDEHFPASLNRLSGMPTHLFGLGDPAALSAVSMAVVGTRIPTPYGKLAAEKLTTGLVQAGLTIVSGFARGIDTVAHQSCLAAGGTTVAVLGSGLGQIYPPENQPLVDEVCRTGCVITEYPPDSPPDARHFPDRNRIIAGLSLGTLVVEAADRGGALITAAMALDMNREVFAVPGDIFQPRAVGTNRLIQNGQAKLVITAQDILQELPGFSGSGPRQPLPPPPDLTLFEASIYDQLSSTPVHVDVLADLVDRTTGDLLIQLLTMEFKGLVRQLPGKYFIRMG